jgi:hypothetical protein
MTMPRTRRYAELRRIDTFEERFDYLSLGGEVGVHTFGFDRWINQLFYRSYHWKQIREEVIIRDGGCDLGVPGYEIHTTLLVHHMNPITATDIENAMEWIIDPEYLITTQLSTHNAIHYGDRSLLPSPFKEREPGDTDLW